MSANNIRNFLAGMGAELGGINRTFQSEDNHGYRMTTDNIQQADNMMRSRLGLTPPQQSYQQQFFEPSFEKESFYSIPQQPQYNLQENKMQNRTDRINKLLGRQVQQEPQIQYIETPRQLEIQNAVAEAIQPILEQLEDIAVINGILVQRIEQLIKVVDPEAHIDDGQQQPAVNNPEQSDNTDTFQEDLPEMEVYDPEVSMSVLEDEEVAVKPKKPKRNKK
jgi:hypothetical protein